VIVPDYDAAPLALSHLLIASRGAAQAMTTKPDPLLKDRLAVPPTATRTFDSRDVLTVFAEAYDNRSKDRGPVELVTSVTDAAGRVMYRSAETVEEFGFEPLRRAWTHRVDIPLKDLVVGEYVVRVDAKPRGAQSSTVTRDVTFSVVARPETTP
jgi:hypothetical protein